LWNIGTSPSLIDMDWDGRVVYGDFNGDGYNDIAGANFKAYLYQGVAGFWLGGANPNTTCDLRIDRPPTSPFHQFGYCMAAGDFNGDGYCDLAISAPHPLDTYDPIYRGYVYIFAGNPDLTDTMVPIDDYLIPPAADNIKINCYPNPFHAESPKISYEIEGELPDHLESVLWTIHNIRGQVVHRQTADQPSKSGSLLPKKLSPGVYVVSLHINGQRVSSSKITIR
ncbi:MAG: T9SS type A sorting domain-containing protein, partial [Candidatus Cloacimonetes bacterium]|nr:T9SS type A sorting domain-containing protein [Candidatus Cloacimonadota bacterium]